MHRAFAVVPFLLAFSAPGHAQAPTNDLRAAFESLAAAPDADEWGRFVTDDAVIVHADGEVHTKRREMDEIRKSSGGPVRKAKGEEVHVYGTTAIRRFEPPTGGVESQVWLQQDGKWRMALSQHTPAKK